MKSCNLVSAFYGANALEQLEFVEKKYKIMKPHEIRNLGQFCDEMQRNDCTLSDLDSFFLGYTIGQIGKEFDLLRFGYDFLLNVELKSEIKKADKQAIILKQMRTNFYYLSALQVRVKIYTLVENDGCYIYDNLHDNLARISLQALANDIHTQNVDYTIDPDKVFIPSNYLISPFNSTEKFINNNYFLTNAQQKIKQEIYEALAVGVGRCFSVSANAGTGKTLLLYDIAKDQQAQGNPLVVHCGKLNQGHETLRIRHNWNIVSIRDIQDRFIDNHLENCTMILIDEAHRIRETQLCLIIEKSVEKNIPLIFAYDIKQYLRSVEVVDIPTFVQRRYPDVDIFQKKLTNKIRTNKELASFINNLISIGSNDHDRNYEDISIDYIDGVDCLKEYMALLQQQEWTALTFTPSNYGSNPYCFLSTLSNLNAHSVIGQEFPKVVFVLDNNFRYNNNKLEARISHYDAKGMLYQIATRVVNELKIIVFENPELYLKLLEIKGLN